MSTKKPLNCRLTTLDGERLGIAIGMLSNSLLASADLVNAPVYSGNEFYRTGFREDDDRRVTRCGRP